MTSPPSSFNIESSALDVRCSSFSDRLLTLSSGQSGLRGGLNVSVQVPPSAEIKNQNAEIQNPDAAILDFVASDATLDRYSETIQATGWKLDSYQRNPVFQNSHQYGNIIHTIGKALITEIRSSDSSTPHSEVADRKVRTPHLFQRIQFAVDANPLARIAHALYAGKFLNAVSVGFIPIRWEDGVGQGSSPAGDGGVSPPFRRRYLEQELLEVSAVGIPANPNALALAYKSGALGKSDLQDTLDIIRQTISTPAHHTPSHDAQELTSFFRSLRDIMKHV